MKCLSVWQPWASLLVHGIKNHETRSWAPPVALIGKRIAIHAGLSRTGLGIFAESAGALWPPSTGAAPDTCLGEPLAFGCILGTAVIDSFIPTDSCLALKVPASQKALGDWSTGRFAWLMTDHEVMESPIPWKGQQGLFTVPDEVAA